MAATLPELFERIRRPLEFASKNDFAALDNVHDLDRTLLAFIEEALTLTVDEPGKTELLRELRLLLRAYADGDESDRRRRIRGALELLDQIEGRPPRAESAAAAEPEADPVGAPPPVTEPVDEPTTESQTVDAPGPETPSERETVDEPTADEVTVDEVTVDERAPETRGDADADDEDGPTDGSRPSALGRWAATSSETMPPPPGAVPEPDEDGDDDEGTVERDAPRQVDAEGEDGKPRKRRRRRRGGRRRRKKSDAEDGDRAAGGNGTSEADGGSGGRASAPGAIPEEGGDDRVTAEFDVEAKIDRESGDHDAVEGDEKPKKKRRRRRRRRRKKRDGAEAAGEGEVDAELEADDGGAREEAGDATVDDDGAEANDNGAEAAEVDDDGAEADDDGAEAADIDDDGATAEIDGEAAGESARAPSRGRSGVRRSGPSVAEARKRVEALGGPVTGIKGVGPKFAALLANMQIQTIDDLLFTLPRDYQDRRTLTPIGELEVGEQQTFAGDVQSLRFSGFGRKRFFDLVVADETGSITGKWFHFQQPAMEKRFAKGQRVVMSGKVDTWQSTVQVVHPETEVLEEGTDPVVAARIVPIYPLTEGLTQNAMRRFVAAAREDFGDQVVGAVPESLLEELELPELPEALRALHEPSLQSDMGALASGMTDAHRSLAYDELFTQQLGLATRRRAASRKRGIAYQIQHDQEAQLRALLPFELTMAQEHALDEIKRDMRSSRPMYRLLQGDVGSGKTIVAVFAALVAVGNEKQVAFMAPTEVVAEQHYAGSQRFLERLGLRTSLLTSSVRPTERDSLYPRIKRGEVDVIFGTHALISEQVKFKRLGLVVIDEQHRFGVEQRAQLAKKGAAPDVLVMSATPIPRSLALTVFGDMDVSALTEVPEGRQTVTTRLLEAAEREEAYDVVRAEAAAGHQAFVVYPTIDASAVTLESAEEAHRRLKTEVFPSLTVGLLHGRLDHAQKEGIINRFRRGAIDVLVSTTVVGVGVDVPNATVMLIEGADRFGLADLHQLRGRVGRGDLAGHCFLIPREDAAEDSLGRLSILGQTHDGFQIAEADLLQRGFGDLLGLRQAGIPAFRVTDLARDGDLLLQARDDATSLVDRDPSLRRKENQVVKIVLKYRWGDALQLGSGSRR